MTAGVLMEQLSDPTVSASLAVGVVSLLIVVILTMKPAKKFLPVNEFQPLALVRKEILSHDTVRFTFGLPSPDHELGLPIGQHLSLKFTNAEGKPVQRSYTPTSLEHTKGEVSLVIKVYRPSPPKFPNGGQMSQHLDSLKIGDTILVKGPKGHMEWKGEGSYQNKPLGKPLQSRYCKQITMIAGGTGITPMLQILHSIFANPSTVMRVKLIYANQSENDILVREELEALAKEYPTQFSLWYTVDKAVTPSWQYDTGFINKDMIEKHGLFSSGPTEFFMCGPVRLLSPEFRSSSIVSHTRSLSSCSQPPMIKFACLPALTELGYSDKEWVIF